MHRIGIYGGTFNPPHMGHIHAAVEAVRALELHRLLVIPDRIAPHKELPEGSASPEQRLEMLKLALEGQENIQLSDMELRREGKSYTYETVAALREQYPDAELILLMGTDMFLTFGEWRHPERILKQASLGYSTVAKRGSRPPLTRKKRKWRQPVIRSIWCVTRWCRFLPQTCGGCWCSDVPGLSCQPGWSAIFSVKVFTEREKATKISL